MSHFVHQQTNECSQHIPPLSVGKFDYTDSLIDFRKTFLRNANKLNMWSLSESPKLPGDSHGLLSRGSFGDVRVLKFRPKWLPGSGCLIIKTVDHYQLIKQEKLQCKAQPACPLPELKHCDYDTIRYDSVYLTCSKKLTGSQLSPPHRTNKKLKCETKNKTMSMIARSGLVPLSWRQWVRLVKEV